MNKLWKWLMGIFLLLLFCILGFVMIENQAVAYLPFRFVSMYNYPWIGGSIPYVLFWGSAVCMVVLLLLFLLLVFSPNTKHSLLLESDQDSLKIQKKALEHFVLTIVRQEPFIAAPSVRIKIPGKTIKVKIVGQMRKSTAIPEKQQALVQEIEQELQRLLETKETIKIQVVLDEYRTTKSNKDSHRVE